MSIQNFPPHTQAIVNTLFGERRDAPTPASDAAPQPRLNRAAVAAAEQLQQQHEGRLDGERLSKALELVLGNAVQIRLDGSATVHSGGGPYTVDNGTCSCADHQNRAIICKHLLAVGVHKRAAALLRGTAKPPVATPAPPAPASAAWDVHEAPTSCYLKFRVGHVELSYTMRDVDDTTLAARLQQVLPRIQATIDAEEARQAERAAARADADGTPAPVPPAAPAPEDAPVCPPHGPMRASTKAPGTYYCPAKMADGSYCKERWPHA